MKIREDAPLDRVALIGCGVPTGVGAVINTAKVKPGSSVVVIGAGGVGLNVVQGAVLAGAEAIIAVDIHGNKLEHALQFGATHLVNAATEDVVERVRDITRGEMADYAFEVIGSTAAINQALSTTKRGGTTVVVGVAPHRRGTDHRPRFPALGPGADGLHLRFLLPPGRHAHAHRPLHGPSSQA